MKPINELTNKELSIKLGELKSKWLDVVPYFVEAEQRKLKEMVWYQSPEQTESYKVIYKYLSSLLMLEDEKQQNSNKYKV